MSAGRVVLCLRAWLGKPASRSRVRRRLLAGTAHRAWNSDRGPCAPQSGRSAKSTRFRGLSPSPVSCSGLRCVPSQTDRLRPAQCPPSIPVLLGRDGRRRRAPRRTQCGAFPVHVGSSPMGAGGIRSVSKREQRPCLRALPENRLRPGVRQAALRVNSCRRVVAFAVVTAAVAEDCRCVFSSCFARTAAPPRLHSHGHSETCAVSALVRLVGLRPALAGGATAHGPTRRSPTTTRMSGE
jgi:hypothetical protein